ncbi:MAG: DnaD domain protein [Clostridia bacterium]|nr:DnaD domain protein [Clostridia bacterium]
MASYKLSEAAGLSAIPVAGVFIDKYMKEANGTYVKVYLYGLRLCYAVGAKPGNAEIAEALDILETDVVRAWKYWQSKGIVFIDEEGSIEFADLTMEMPSKKKTVTKPQYNAEELAAAVSEDSQMAVLLDYAQNIFGRTLSRNDISKLYGFYDWLKLPVEVIMMLLEHCATLEKCHMSYAEKIAIAWAEQGVDTIEKAESHLKNADKKAKLSRKYKRMLGITGRDLSESEYAHILQWTEEMGFMPELIKMAYEKAVLATGHASFPYINAILKSWHTQNIKTVADVAKDTAPTAIPAPRKAKTNKFLNYQQTAVYDFDAIERRALEKRIKEYG